MKKSSEGEMYGKMFLDFGFWLSGEENRDKRVNINF